MRGFWGKVGFAVAFLGVLAAIGFLASEDSGQPSREARDGKIPGVITSICGGAEWSLAEARASTSFELYLPNHALANDENMSAVWNCAEDHVALEYSSGVVVYLSVNALESPEETWARIADLYPEFSVGVVRGQSASLVDPAKDETGTAEGGVDLVESGIRITVSGDGEIPLEDLIAVTESLQQESSPSPSPAN
ncbi:MAG: hypothetical protein ACRDGU_09350 [Actinomycetota bacterium]